MGAVILVLLTGILILLLRAEHREKVDDTNKKVFLHGGKNVNPDAAPSEAKIIIDDLDRTHTVIKNRKGSGVVFILRLTEPRRHTVYQGEFKDREILVGRMAKHQKDTEKGWLCVKDVKVSHEHCRIYREQDHYMVEDCHSANHTWVNGHPVICAMPLQDGDRLRLARKTYIVKFLMEPAEEI